MVGRQVVDVSRYQARLVPTHAWEAMSVERIVELEQRVAELEAEVARRSALIR
ncbi:MAG TPA: hypothetical protein VF855_09815 [Acidimicrobiales bacterium]